MSVHPKSKAIPITHTSTYILTFSITILWVTHMRLLYEYIYIPSDFTVTYYLYYYYYYAHIVQINCPIDLTTIFKNSNTHQFVDCQQPPNTQQILFQTSSAAGSPCLMCVLIAAPTMYIYICIQTIVPISTPLLCARFHYEFTQWKCTSLDIINICTQFPHNIRIG